MNNFKSQGQTFEEARANMDEGVFVEDPFFKQHLENIRKQRELGLEFDMDKVKEIVGWACDFGSDAPSAVRRVILDMDHLPRLNKTYMPPKDGDAFICMESDIDWSRLEELCKADVPRPDLHISGEDPALEIRKHPMIFKVTDLVEDEGELSRLKATLERNRETEKSLGWPAPPMFIEAIPDANIVARACTDLMSQLTALAKEYKVEIYFGTKAALKTALYTLMYGGKKKDLDMAQIDEISVEKAVEMYESKLRKVAIIGGAGLGFGKMAKLLADHYSEETVCLDSFDTWNFKDFAAVAKAEKPARDWEHTKLRRGKGHNKFKRKGKK